MLPPIRDVKAKYESQILQLPDVVSVGIGRNESGCPAIIVGMLRPNPETESKLPQNLEGYPVVMQIVGRIKAQ